MSRIEHAALSVACPTCKAPTGADCPGRKKFHVARAQRGLNRALRDEYRVHERSRRAIGRLSVALTTRRPAADTDVTEALLSCGCAECRANVRPLAHLLHQLGVLT